MRREPVSVIGGGAWGTALAIHAARLGHPARQWVYEPDLCATMRERRENDVYLPGIELPGLLEPVGELPAAVKDAELVLAAVPSPFARAVYGPLGAALAPGVPVVVATKGIEAETLALPLQVAQAALGAERPLAILSGPSFAREVAGGLPAALVVAAADPGLAAQVQTALASPSFRLYTNNDPDGVQVAGALKNVMAIAAGAIDGLEMGTNCMAALVTRGLAEIMRLGLAMGGAAETFAGLAGLGDLVLTCTGQLSRNRGVGYRLGRGESLERILAASRSVAEGVRTTRSAHELATRLRVEMPIVEQVYRILYEGRPPREAVGELMTRPLRSEARPDEAEPAS